LAKDISNAMPTTMPISIMIKLLELKLQVL